MKKRLVIAAVVFVLLLSLALNAVLYGRLVNSLEDEQQVFLDPLGLDGFERPDIGAGKLVVGLGDSRIADWPFPDMPGYTFANYGIGGQTSEGVALRWAVQSQEIRPDVLIIQVCINDLKNIGLFPARAEAIVQNCKDNIDTLVSLSDGAAVVLTTIFPVREPSIERLPFWSNETMAAVNEVNQYIGSLEGGNVMVFDTFALLVDGSGRLDGRYSEDGIHLNAAGYQVLNEALMRLLAS